MIKLTADDVARFCSSVDASIRQLECLSTSATARRIELGGAAFDPEDWKRLVLEVTDEAQAISTSMTEALAELLGLGRGSVGPVQ